MEVAAAIIRKGEKFLICQRPANKNLGLLWEFPGGKVETGETGEQTIIRECREELGVTLKVDSFFMDVTHEYPDMTVHLSVYNCSLIDSEPVMLEHTDMRWITASQCGEFEFCPADMEILVRLVKCEKAYLYDHFCPVYNRIIDSELCYESVMCLSGFFTISSIEELHRIFIPEMREMCDKCPFSDLS